MNNNNDDNNNNNNSKFVQKNERLTWKAANSFNEGFFALLKKTLYNKLI